MYIPGIEERRTEIANKIQDLTVEQNDLADLELRLDEIVEEVTDTVRSVMTDLIDEETSNSLYGLEIDDGLMSDIFEAITETVESNL